MVQFIELLGNRNLIKILDFFLNNPSTEISQIELKKRLKLAKATMVKWMGYLVKNSFIEKRVIGVTNLYKLNKENNLNKELKRLLNVLRLKILGSLKDKYNCEIYLYGSAARGENTESSDIDILIIGNIRRRDIIEEIENCSKIIKAKISLKIFTNLEWSKISRDDKSFFERVEKDKIRLVQ